MERLQKVMAHAGVASRRKSEDLITRGRVRVNGQVVTELGTRVDPEKDRIEVDGQEINREKQVYYLLNKPTGFVTTVDDPRGRKTVLDLIKGVSQRIYPVGRLDYDTSGLLLLTNDGELTYLLTHPSHLIEKTYLVEVAGLPGYSDFKKLEDGIELDDGMTAPARVSSVRKKGGHTIFKLTIHEGRNRQVRRMCDALGYPVEKLKRTDFGPLHLAGLKEGHYRPLSSQEINKLQLLK